MEYKVIDFIGLTAKELEVELNRLAQEDWRVSCSCYTTGTWLVLERHSFVAPKPLTLNWAVSNQPYPAGVG